MIRAPYLTHSLGIAQNPKQSLSLKVLQITKAIRVRCSKARAVAVCFKAGQPPFDY
jgi:hypothetical protein